VRTSMPDVVLLAVQQQAVRKVWCRNRHVAEGQLRGSW